MTRYVVLALILAMFLVISLSYIAKPEMLDEKVNQLINPIKQALEVRNNRKIAEAKEKYFKERMYLYKVPINCNNPQTALKELECRKDLEEYENQVSWDWNSLLKSGWKPD